MATKGAQWSENDIASEDFEQTSFKFGGFKLALSLFFPHIFTVLCSTMRVKRGRGRCIGTDSRLFRNVGDVFIFLNLCSKMWAKRGRGRCIGADSRLFENVCDIFVFLNVDEDGQLGGCIDADSRSFQNVGDNFIFLNVGEEGQRSVHRSTQSWLNLALTATNRMHQTSYRNVGPE